MKSGRAPVFDTGALFLGEAGLIDSFTTRTEDEIFSCELKSGQHRRDH